MSPACRLQPVPGSSRLMPCRLFTRWATARMASDDIVRRAGDHLKRTVDRILDEKRQLPEVTRVTVEDLDFDGEIAEDRIEVDCDICDEHVPVPPGMAGRRRRNVARPSNRFLSTLGTTSCASPVRTRGNERTTMISTGGVLFMIGLTT